MYSAINNALYNIWNDWLLTYNALYTNTTRCRLRGTSITAFHTPAAGPTVSLPHSNLCCCSCWAAPLLSSPCPARATAASPPLRVDGRMVRRYLAATAETLFLKYNFLQNDDPYRH